jgi:nucleotide-binding universal stress UspA family protein
MTLASDLHRSDGAVRVLLAVHGGEAAGWGPEARRILAPWSTPAAVRVLAVFNAPRPAFTSLLPAAARRYRAACDAWQRVEADRLQRLLDDLTPLLPATADVVWAPAVQGAPGRAIAEYAATWSADVIVTGAAPAPGPWLGAVHEHLIRLAPCPVVVTPGPVVPRRTARVPRSALTRKWRRLGVAAGQEA